MTDRGGWNTGDHCLHGLIFEALKGGIGPTTHGATGSIAWF